MLTNDDKQEEEKDEEEDEEMIVVFVIDTSPSMRLPLAEGSTTEKRWAGSGMSRLDLAKMAVEDVVRGLTKRVVEHNVVLQQQPQLQVPFRNLGLGFCPNDKFLLLSTGRQHLQQPATAACGAGGRLLVGYGDHNEQASDNPSDQPQPHQSNTDSFQRELKQLQATVWEPTQAKDGKKPVPFPEDGGGANGLNIALSAGLQLLSRYRLSFRSTENFGMGRLPSPAVLNPSGGAATNALQPACLILITDGACLLAPPAEGGGALQLQYGKSEFYTEPFRWDQRVFCLGVGAKDGTSSTQFLHSHLRALCELTGGSHMMLRSSASLSQVTDTLLKLIAPPRPRDLPLSDALRLQAQHTPTVGTNGTFVNGGPVCCFQALERDLDSSQPVKHRAMLLYVPHQQAQTAVQKDYDPQESFQPPIWCIPESHFPSKKLDALPPRAAQPTLLFSRYPERLGSKSFDAATVMKLLHRLDHLVLANRKNQSSAQNAAQGFSQVKLLQRDVYICEWVSLDGKPPKGPTPHGTEYFPVIVVGAGRPALSEGEVSHFNIGILHVPSNSSTLAFSLASGARLSTLTLLPPEPHILLPLLIRAAEAEHRTIKKAGASESKESNAGGATAGLIQKQSAGSRSVHLDEHWRTEFRAYMFRVPPYYQNALKRSLRPVLPASVHALLNSDSMEGALASQCFSKTCLQKIRTAEQISSETNDRLERQEAELRRRGMQNFETQAREQHQQHLSKQRGSVQVDQNADLRSIAAPVGYGQYDPRSTTESFLAALRNMPAPWRVGASARLKDAKPDHVSVDGVSETASMTSVHENRSRSIVDVLEDLPANCLMAYYESRRRWIFGGSGLSTRGLFVEGVHNDGCNVQHAPAKPDILADSLLSLAGVGVSRLNAVTTSKMGDYRERLLWSRAPVVGYGSNDAAGVSATNSADGSPKWSVDDDAMPVSFFDQRTGEFADSVQARVRTRLMVNFGNPYKDKRADTLVPERFHSQCPSSKQSGIDAGDDGARTPPGSPPHDSFSTSEGEGEAVFSRKSPSRKSPSRSDHFDDHIVSPDTKRPKLGSEVNEETASSGEKGKEEKLPVGEKTSPIISKPKAAEEKNSTGEKKSPTTSKPKAAIAKGPPPPPPPPPPPKGGPSKKPPPPGPPPNRPHPLAPSVQPPKAPSTQQQQSSPGSTPSQKPPPPQSSSASPSAKPPPPRRPSLPFVKPAPPHPPHQQQQQQQQQEQQKKLKETQTTQMTQTPAPMDLVSPDKKPNVDLPPGWMCVWSKSQKRWYFFDTKTNKSVWEWPPP